MKYFNFFIFLGLAFFMCKEKSSKDTALQSEEQKIVNPILAPDSANAIIELLRKVSPEVLKGSREKINNFIDGYVIDEAGINMRMLKIDNEVKYVYFYKSDFDAIFRNLQCSGKEGVRIYLYKYKSDLNTSLNGPHPYRNKYTVVLQGTCQNTESINDSTKFDYGDVCPPNCREVIQPWFPKEQRDEQAAKDGAIKGK